MKKFRVFQQFDLAVQSLLAICVNFPLILAVIEPGFLMWSLLALLPFGAWQLLSALILGFQDKFRHLYFLTAIAFCGLFYTGAFFLNRFAGIQDLLNRLDLDISKYLYLAFLLLSYVAGLFYFTYSCRTFRMEKNNTHNDLPY